MKICQGYKQKTGDNAFGDMVFLSTTTDLVFEKTDNGNGEELSETLRKLKEIDSTLQSNIDKTKSDLTSTIDQVKSDLKTADAALEQAYKLADTTLNTRITNVKIELDDKDANLTNDLNDTKKRVTDLESGLGTANGEIAKKANSSTVEALSNTVNTVNTELDSKASTQALEDGLKGKADTTTVDELIQGLQEQIQALIKRVDALENPTDPEQSQ